MSGRFVMWHPLTDCDEGSISAHSGSGNAENRLRRAHVKYGCRWGAAEQRLMTALPDVGFCPAEPARRWVAHSNGITHRRRPPRMRRSSQADARRKKIPRMPSIDLTEKGGDRVQRGHRFRHRNGRDMVRVCSLPSWCGTAGRRRNRLRLIRYKGADRSVKPSLLIAGESRTRIRPKPARSERRLPARLLRPVCRNKSVLIRRNAIGKPDGPVRGLDDHVVRTVEASCAKTARPEHLHCASLAQCA